jgi:23S rRNA (cytidine1920-2'-O)/16S rRNA (cytidine1409-2'-O)-methyltransferase
MLAMGEKLRLDQLLVARRLAPSRQQAQALIMAGKVLVADTPVDKPGAFIAADAPVVLKGEMPRYVSRGGLKLEAALEGFGVDAAGLTCLDVGAATGGFTDCLLQRGARKVFAVDVGYGQLAWKLRRDGRVTAIERTNIRHLHPEAIACPVDLAVVDVSFISLTIVIPAVVPLLKPLAWLVALIKPQFEVGRGQVGRGGVVRNPSQHQAVIRKVRDFCTAGGLRVQGVVPSPILGPKGNREFFIGLRTPPQERRCCFCP